MNEQPIAMVKALAHKIENGKQRERMGKHSKGLLSQIIAVLVLVFLFSCCIVGVFSVISGDGGSAVEGSKIPLRYHLDGMESERIQAGPALPIVTLVLVM